jgi:hypothetical protein
MTLSLVAILVWPGFTTDAAADDASGSIRPRFEVTTEEAFDTDTVPPYAGQHDEVYVHIDRHLDEHVRQIQRWIRQPSISPLGIGIDEMAELVRRDFVDMGFSEAELVPTRSQPG